ncbi:FliH/SctL family protein [Nocardioides sp. YIM 152588]|uniref:FliH/SctL family protein n=1 Tax=Nocardioides sp. YIM 152588 TaxID=3158259 RepID=UPI0032E4B765
MSSSSERVTAPASGPAVVVGADAAGLAPVALPELRRGSWTRLGGSSVLGDELTESLLGGLADQARDAATAQGYAVGWAQGRREAAAEAAEQARLVDADRAAEDARREAEHRVAVEALATAAAEVRGVLAGLAADLEAQGTELAWALVEELLGHQIRAEAGADVVRRVLAVLPEEPLATVRLHPDVVGIAAAAELADRGLTVRTDRGLAPGDAVVECDGSVVDLRLDRARERVRRALGADPDDGVY